MHKWGRRIQEIFFFFPCASYMASGQTPSHCACQASLGAQQKERGEGLWSQPSFVLPAELARYIGGRNLHYPETIPAGVPSWMGQLLLIPLSTSLFLSSPTEPFICTLPCHSSFQLVCAFWAIFPCSETYF